MNGIDICSFYRGKRVLVTGHTGFKGSWLCRLLQRAGAEVTGFSLTPPTSPALFDLAKIGDDMNSIIGDVRDRDALQKAFEEAEPEIVIHMAAQSLVRASYRDPASTHSINEMGTINLLECVRNTRGIRAVVNVTTDKVYRNGGEEKAFCEEAPLGGDDPYSSSKACSDLITQSYWKSYWSDGTLGVATLRAGNAVGGGDFAKDRLVPDFVRSVQKGVPFSLRHPNSRRPYQHVLDVLHAYLTVATGIAVDPKKSGAYNVGPKAKSERTEELAAQLCAIWNEKRKGHLPAASFDVAKETGPAEAGAIFLACDKMREAFSWEPAWDLTTALFEVVEFMNVHQRNEDLRTHMDRVIARYWEDV